MRGRIVVGLLLASVPFAAAACGSDDAVPTTSGPPAATDPPVSSTAASSTTGPQVDGPLVLELSASGGVAGGPAVVTATLTNVSGAPLTVVRPFVSPNFVRFTVSGTDGPVPFDGPYYRMAPLEDEGFAELQPGDSVSHSFDLAESYDLDAGTYDVSAEYRNPARGSHEGDRAFIAEPGEGIVSAPITIEVSP